MDNTDQFPYDVFSFTRVCIKKNVLIDSESYTRVKNRNSNCIMWFSFISDLKTILAICTLLQL